MRIIHINPLDTELPHLGEAVCAIGVFDGMHLGHRLIFEQARKKAEELKLPLVGVTFDKDPDEIFRKDDPSFGKLLSNAMRLEMIGQQATGDVLSIPTIAEVLAIEPERFLELLGSVITPRAIFTGVDFHFGAKAKGTSQDLLQWAGAHGCEYVACDLLEVEGEIVSSTRIRKELRQGKVAQAKHLLACRPHSVYGNVVHGRGQGDGFGFATANLDLSHCEVMLPREGVYGGYAIVAGKRYPAAINVGVAKSFEAATAPVEAHLLDFDGDLYGKEIIIEFEEWLREPRVFKTQDELIETVMGNINWVRENLRVS